MLLREGRYEISEGHINRLDGIASDASTALEDLKAIDTALEFLVTDHLFLVTGDPAREHWWQQLGDMLYERGELKLGQLLEDGPAVELAASASDMAGALRNERASSSPEQHRVQRRFSLVGIETAARSVQTVFHRICVAHAALHQACTTAPQGVEAHQRVLLSQVTNEVQALLDRGILLDDKFEALLRRVDSGELTAEEFKLVYDRLLHEATWNVFAVRVYGLHRWLASASLQLENEYRKELERLVVDMSSAAIDMARKLRGPNETAEQRREATQTFKDSATNLLGVLNMSLSD